MTTYDDFRRLSLSAFPRGTSESRRDFCPSFCFEGCFDGEIAVLHLLPTAEVMTTPEERADYVSPAGPLSYRLNHGITLRMS